MMMMMKLKEESKKITMPRLRQVRNGSWRIEFKTQMDRIGRRHCSAD
jgi:hypothetical protein